MKNAYQVQPLDPFEEQFQEACRQVDDVGYAIMKKVIPVESINQIRDYWLDTFSKVEPKVRVTWSPFWGQPNQTGFSSDSFQHLFRAHDFLWNPPSHAVTREVLLRMNALRNRMAGRDEEFGTSFSDGKDAVCFTASYYPPGKGFMASHVDGRTDNKMLLHCLLPVTFKGRDYKDGGLIMTDMKKKQVDVDGAMEPGDIVFYNGGLPHEVLPIVAKEGKNIGRLQVFPLIGIESIQNNLQALDRIPLSTFMRAKWLGLRNRLRIKLGLKLISR